MAASATQPQTQTQTQDGLAIASVSTVEEFGTTLEIVQTTRDRRQQWMADGAGDPWASALDARCSLLCIARWRPTSFVAATQVLLRAL
jgi:hypothetical protein